MSALRADRPPPPVPDRLSHAALREAVQSCRACDLWEGATQAVMGEGPKDASLMLVGEVPGDKEDLQGHVFVGPAGAVLDTGLEQAAIVRDEVYMTNVVKHFRYEIRGKRRIHQKPDRWQVSACRPWFEAELALVKPAALVCLGAVAAQALIGPDIRIGRDRGQPIDSDLAELVIVTAHPSSILRAPDTRAREAAMKQFVSDLRSVKQWLSTR